MGDPSDSTPGKLDALARAVRERPPGALERHVQTLLLSVSTAALLFAANYFYEDNRRKAVMAAQLDALTTQVVEMRSDMRALQGSYVRRDELRDLEARVRALEIRGR